MGEANLSGLFRKAAIAVLVALPLTLGAAAAGGVAAPARAAPNDPGASPPPQAVQPVTPRHFSGDVRRIPRGNVIQPEERPEPKSPNESPPASIPGDPALQNPGPAAPAPSPTTSWSGLDFANWGAGWPPDPNGDVGPTYYVQTVNTSVGIFEKATGNRVAAFTFNGLFGSAATGTPCDNSNQGDPVALYDPIGDRFIVSDFAWSNYASGAMYECMAVSRTSNPVTGGWYFYAWQVETGGKIPDYPKLGVWPDGIYMSANVFSTTGSGSFKNVQVWVFNRQEMEAGTTAHAVTFSLPRTSGGTSIFSLLPSNARVVTGLPPTGAPNYFASIWGSYAIRVWKFHVDWANAANSTFDGPTNVPIATFNVGPSDAPELGGNNIDTLSYRLMMQNQYSNLNGVESLWLTHTVGSGGSPNTAQVRWYQLPVTGGAVAGSPAQQSTFGPDTKNRFMPSLALDKNGDMAIGYSVSDAAMYPSIRYAGRLATDPANTLGQTESSLIEGTGFQCCTFSDGSTNTRWGDYSAMTIDPDGCTFWYTNEYYDTKPTTKAQDNWKTRIGSFRFGSCSSSTAPAPIVSSFTPGSGTVGTSVTISGSNFTAASSVTFNGAAASYAVNSGGTQITATVPGTATSGPISVTTSGGTASSSASFSVVPVISSISPASGPVGSSVALNGSGLTGAATVTFTSGVSSAFSVNSGGTQITTTVPNGASTGPITVTMGDAATVVSPSFTVTVAQAPTISSISPTSGTRGSSVAISGSAFAGTTSVTIAGKSARFTIDSDAHITATVPQSARGSGPVTVTTPAGTATSTQIFTVTG